MVPTTTPTPTGLSLREAVDAFLSCPRCANPNTRRPYAAALDGVLVGLGRDRALATLASDELAAAFATTWMDTAPATWNRNRAVVSSWLAWCTKNRWNATALLPALERRREHANHTKALPRAAIERQLTHRDIPLGEKTLWRMLYETAATCAHTSAKPAWATTEPGCC